MKSMLEEANTPILDLLLQPLLELLHRLSPMRDLVLLLSRHFRICLAIVLKARVPA